MPFDVVCQAIEVFTCHFMNAYGQTESTSSLTYLGPDDHRMNGTEEENANKLHPLRSVGRPMDDSRSRHPQRCRRAACIRRRRRVCVRSARVMKEYPKQGEAIAAAIVDGWLHTGDVGFLDEDNYLFITGRVKDLIIRGGENIAPGEIEAVLDSSHLVEESAVIGVPDAEWGEAVKAIVVRSPAAIEEARDVDELRARLQAYCKQRLASFKTPAYVAFVEELPRNPMGKVPKDRPPSRPRWGRQRVAA